MTDTNVIEQRLRRAFQAVAEEPVASLDIDPGIQLTGISPPSRRRSGLLVGVAAALVIAVGALALVYGPRSSAPGQRTPGQVVATFVAASPTASRPQIAADARQLARRLDSLHDSTASVVARGRSVVVIGGTRLPVAESSLLASDTVQFRPVLCASAPYTPSAQGATGGPLPTAACASSIYSLQAPNLTVDTATGTSNEASIALDPALAAYPTSTSTYDETHADSPVLIPVDDGGGARDLLGPSELNARAFASAHASLQNSQWVVNAELTSDGSSQWDALAHRYFHEILGIDLDGRVVSAPLDQPNQSTFTSFAGTVQISGSFTEQSAEEFAAALNSGPLATPLTSTANQRGVNHNF